MTVIKNSTPFISFFPSLALNLKESSGIEAVAPSFRYSELLVVMVGVSSLTAVTAML